MLGVAQVSPAEFWAHRRSELYAAAQQQGFTSRQPDADEKARAAEASVQAEREAAAAAAAGGAGSGGSGGRTQVSVRLTPAMKHRIFADYPDVHQLFLQV